MIEMGENRDRHGLFGLIALLVFATVALTSITFLAYLVWKGSKESVLTASEIEQARHVIRELELRGV